MTGSELLLGQNLYALDALEERVGQVIRQLPLRGPDGTYLIPDDALRATTISASAASKAIWKLACAARAEIVRRITERTQDCTVIAREIAREATEQGVSARILRRDAQIGLTFGPLFAEPDTAPDLDRTYYSIALRSPDPPAALALAQERKDQNPYYSTSDFEAEIARARLSDPAAGYGFAMAGRCGLAYLWPFWDEGVVVASEKAIGLPLRRWLFPDAIILLRVPPRALDLGCRILSAHNTHYQTAITLPTPTYRDGCAWQEHEMVLFGTVGKLRLPDGLPGTWRDRVERSIDLYFSFANPKLVIFPRCGMTLGDGWTTVDALPDHIR